MAGQHGRKAALAGVSILAMAFAAPAAFAETCVSAGGVGVLDNTAGLPSLASSTANNIVSAINSANSVFLTQSAALVGVPKASEGEIGGGSWTRGVGGYVDTKSRSVTNVTTIVDGAGLNAGLSGVVACDSKIHSVYKGVQGGGDIGKLNWGGFAIHAGVTIGALNSQNSVVGGPALPIQGALFGTANTVTGINAFTSSSQIPFFGVYTTVNHSSGFFAEFLARGQIFQNMLNSSQFNLFNQHVGARGFSLAASAGWNYVIPNTNWFVEPSLGFIASRVSVDPLTLSGPVNAGVPGTLSVNAIANQIGRAGVRVGTSFTAGPLTLQPFAAVSIWHDFIAANYSRYVTAPGAAFVGAAPAVLGLDVRNQNFGTFGQYSAGISGALTGTGWLGFARVDVRQGSRLEGVNATAGLRYQFTPEQRSMVAKVTKGYDQPVVAAAALYPTWGGFYGGWHSAASLGTGYYNFGNGLISEPRTSGFGGGGQIGYNYMWGPYLAGIEGDGTFLDTRGSRACAPQGGNGPFGGSFGATTALFNVQCKARNPWTASVTGRFGYAWDKVLFFARGGVAFTRELFEARCNSLDPTIFTTCTGPFGGIAGFNTPAFFGAGVSTPPVAGFTTSQTRAGLSVGAGFEFRISKAWSAKAEYNYMDFGSRTRVFSDGTVARVGTSTSVVKVGTNYHFSAWPDFW